MEDFDLPENHRTCCSSFSKLNSDKRRRIREELEEERDIFGGKRRSIGVVRRALVNLKHFDVPLLSAATESPLHSLRLRPRLHPYSIGRSARRCDFLFADRRVSNRHCQIFFDPLLRRLYLKEFRASMNGVFVNGVRLRRGLPAELSAGDEVSLVCANWNCCNSLLRVGFAIESVVFEEKIVSQAVQLQLQSQSQSQGSVSSWNGNKRVYASKIGEDFNFSDVINRASRLLSQCAEILRSDDPVSCILANSCTADSLCRQSGDIVCSENATGTDNTRKQMVSECVGKDCSGADYIREESVLDCLGKDCSPLAGGLVKRKISTAHFVKPPGKTFYLNRLGFMDDISSSHPTEISLQELLHPVERISKMFIATFTSDILWFLSFCEIPRNLPVTLACHSTERCWNSSPGQRTFVPYPDFPNLVVVYPVFPEEIAFGKGLKKQGIGCHHPKLFVLQRDDFLRVIITSANLVPTQWNAVTNTIWWQDFPRRSSPDYMPLFTQIHNWEINQEPKSDFCSQLAGFIASLLTDVPSQAHWIVELTKYDFSKATADLVASVPGIHSYRAPNIFPSIHFLQGAASSSGVKFLGSVEASVVGLSYLFHKAADSNGAQLKKLASFMGRSSENADGFSKVLLKRNKTIPADENAVSILVPSPKGLPCEDCVQLGFLPRKVAKWVSPLWDFGFFRFSAYVCHKQALTAALGGSNKKVTLSLHVSQGPNFEDITKMMQPEHIVAICSMIASIQRCTGLWRLQEVLAQYKWPEELQSDFIYGASSIGSINARFLAAFSAAAGKTSLQFDSDESDPEWGCWSTSQELKNPSIRILFPTINRIRSAVNGVLPSKRILCFSERTWERLRHIDILHDAIPHPHNRVGHPMHIKVARRRFKSRTNSSSFGWVYCGSHNFSAAAWGLPISNSNGAINDEEGTPGSSSNLRLHVCNYELGVVFTFPPTETKSGASKSSMGLDDIILPYVVPAPKYGPRDRPATAKAMREALAALNELERQNLVEVEEVPDEGELAEDSNFVVEEKEEEKAYAKMLWNQIDLSLKINSRS